MSKKYVGVEIGGTKIQIIVTDDNISILERHKFFVGERKAAAGILKGLNEKITGIVKKNQIDGIGIGFGGPVNYKTGIIYKSHHIEGWNHFNLKEWMYSLSGIPTIVDNDANTAALAEAHFGAGKTLSRVFYITLGSGVGGGLVIDGEVYHGNKPTEVEIGHVRLNKKGTILENRCSGWAVDRKIRKYVKKHPESSLAVITKKQKSGEAKYLMEAIHMGDEGATRILENTADDLAFGLSHVVHLFNPEMIILGGGLSLIGSPLSNTVKKNLSAYIMKAMKVPEIRIAMLKEDVVSVGASYMAKKHIDNL